MSKILIIDDSKDMIHLFREMVTLLGHDVITSGDGRSGLALIRNQEPDLVLLDLMMPDMNGWQVYEQLRTFSTVPVIFVTADFNGGNLIKARSLGASLLKKNVTPVELGDAIRTNLPAAQGPAISSSQAR